MFDIHQSVTALHLFAQTHGQAMQHAALLLGGRPWLRRTQRLLDDLHDKQPVTRRIIRESLALLSLLRLDKVHEFGSPKAAFFAELDPAAPYIDEICLLTEALEEAIAEAQAVSPWAGCDEQIPRGLNPSFPGRHHSPSSRPSKEAARQPDSGHKSVGKLHVVH